MLTWPKVSTTPSLAAMRLASASSRRDAASDGDGDGNDMFLVCRGRRHYRARPKTQQPCVRLDLKAPSARLDAAMAAQIVISDVNHVYRPPRGREVLALDQVSLEVANREFVALLGPSGC